MPAQKTCSWKQFGDDQLWNSQFLNLAFNSDANFITAGNYEKVRVWKWSETSARWNQKGNAILRLSHGDVAISSDGNTLAVADTLDAGHVEVYHWTGTQWDQLGQNIVGEAANDQSGHKIAISGSGNVVAISSAKNNNDDGHVRVYEWDIFTQTWTIRGNDIDATEHHLTMNSEGNVVGVGHAGFDQMRVFKWDSASASWTLQHIFPGFFIALNLYGTTVAIGHDDYAQIFNWNGSHWTQRGTDITGLDNINDDFAIDQNGNTVAINANQIFDYDADSWTQRTTLADRVANASDAMDLADDGLKIATPSAVYEYRCEEKDTDEEHTTKLVFWILITITTTIFLFFILLATIQNQITSVATTKLKVLFT